MRVTDLFLSLPSLFVLIVASTMLQGTPFATAYGGIAESGLSYPGFGIQPPTATWGNRLEDAQVYLTREPWLAVFPGLMIFVTVMSVNAIGDGLRDAFDPRRVMGAR